MPWFSSLSTSVSGVGSASNSAIMSVASARSACSEKLAGRNLRNIRPNRPSNNGECGACSAPRTPPWLRPTANPGISTSDLISTIDYTQYDRDVKADCVAIVGAGAAGLATAIFARRFNRARSVVLLDSAKKPGAKILVSGGARCNVTNARVSEADFWGGRSTIVRNVLRAFPSADTVAFFQEIGVCLHEEADGKLFPGTNRARDVLDSLLREAAAD